MRLEVEVGVVMVVVVAVSFCVIVLPMVSEVTGEIEGKLLWGCLWPESLHQLLKWNTW